MLETFGGYSARAIEAKRGRSIDLYVELYNRSHKIAELIYNAIDKQSVEQLRLSTEQYQAMSSRINAMQVFNAALVVAVILVNVVVIILFSKRFTAPITQLVRTTSQVAQGNFDVEQPAVETHDEIAALTDAFYRMVRELKTYFAEITEKAELEVSLKEERMRNLHMESELHEAEFKALQAQMNPHFIYNTINIGAQIAMLEGDEKTSVFLEKVADVFRYNLRPMAAPVTLRDEIDNIRAYMFVLKMRFADLVEYVEDVERDEAMLQTPMPRLTLQPIVENAYRHGLSEMENGGRIAFVARRVGGRAVLSVSDNGAGMTRSQIDDALAGKSGTAGSTATGLGIGNIIQRLRLFLGEDVLSIESEKGKGTVVTLRLPVRN
jgi:sensor histidine kinase YesM